MHFCCSVIASSKKKIYTHTQIDFCFDALALVVYISPLWLCLFSVGGSLDSSTSESHSTFLSYR